MTPNVRRVNRDQGILCKQFTNRSLSADRQLDLNTHFLSHIFLETLQSQPVRLLIMLNNSSY